MPRKTVAEEKVNKKEVTLVKDGVEYKLTDPVMISAFKKQGFEEE